MTIRRAAGLAIGSMGCIAMAPLAAAPWVLSGHTTLRGGYEANPYLTTPSPGGAGLGGAGISVQATRRAPRAETTLTGQADIAQYTSRYGRNSNLLAGFSRMQQLTEHLQARANATYTDTLNPQTNFGTNAIAGTGVPIDYLTVGNRSRRIDGMLNVDWKAGPRDTLRVGGSASHASYGGLLDSRYDQVGATFSYLHDLSGRTRIGVQGSASTVRASRTPSSQSQEVLLLVVREIDARWRFEGGIGAVRQQGGGPFGQRGTTLSFSGSLCGTYPRFSACLVARRSAAPSGIGGLRTDTQARIDALYDLSERSRITLAAAIDRSSGGDSTLIPRQLYYDATLGYARRVTRRLSLGGTARVQRRDIARTTFFDDRSATGYALAGNATYDFGRLANERDAGL